MRKCLALAAFSLLLPLAPAWAASYTITDLGDLGGRSGRTIAHGMNNKGQIVGSSASPNGSRGFVWSKETGMVSVGDLPGGSRWSLAKDINDSGVVTGVSSGAGFENRGFRWTAKGGMVALNKLAGGSGGFAGGINNSGVSVGYVTNNRDRDRPAIWAKDGGLTTLPTPSTFTKYAEATDINDAGHVVGYTARSGSSGARGFVWDGAKMTDLGDLDGGAIDTSAQAINNKGQIVGKAFTAKGSRAFLWEKGVGMTNLGSLGANRFDVSEAKDINDRGQVVGTSRVKFRTRGFIWDKKNGMVDLNSLIDPNSGWFIYSAIAIDNYGRIAGTARNANGSSRAFIMTPTSTAPVPLPATLPLLALGLAGLARISRRRAS